MESNKSYSYSGKVCYCSYPELNKFVNKQNEFINTLEIAKLLIEVTELKTVLSFYSNKYNYTAGSAGKESGHISNLEKDNWGDKARRILNENNND